jgi:hypothetical protein
MTFGTVFPLAIVAVAIVVPIAREYAAFRREWGIGRVAALGTAFTLFPALALALVLSQPLGAWPALQWLTTIVATIVAYSAATALLRPSAPDAQPVRQRSR